MPIRFRCTHCQSLMAISSRKAGAIVNCATCGEKTLVPHDDVFTQVPIAVEDTSDKREPPSVEPQTSAPPPDDHGSPFEDQFSNQEARRPDMAPSTFENSPNDQPFVPSDFDDDGDDNGGPLTIQRHRNLDEEMDLTPMVDVTFQLLIFFMVSASFSLQKSIEVPTPDPDQKGATQQVQTLDDVKGTSIVVKIDASNTIWIDEEQLADSHRLVDTLRDKMRREQKTELLVTAHPQSLHRTIIAVVDAANEIGVQKIRMSSHKKSE